ncbi:hypothetical protein OE88DRAFT_1649245 [Heliocybe sulcata]|uniref:Uncharacterized protein n=1 Tax=Heliocybe sulcata TaxID=5364 RepID=A0A5C3MND3_9AGAM|nr:hypothetical protein OE88DRAFT_1649245 [Heliocybe sulcata]
MLISAAGHALMPVVLDYDVEGGLQEAQELAEEQARRQEEGADGTVEEPSAEDDLRIIHDHRFHHGCTQRIPESVNGEEKGAQQEASKPAQAWTAGALFRLSSIRSAGSPPPATYAYLKTYYALSPDNLQFIEIDFSLPGNVSRRHKNALADARRTLENITEIFEGSSPIRFSSFSRRTPTVFEAVIGDDLMDWISRNTVRRYFFLLACGSVTSADGMLANVREECQRLRITDGFAFTGARFLMEEVTSFSIQFTQRVVVQGADTEKVLRTILNASHPLELRNDVIWFHTHPVDGQVKFRQVAYWTNLTSIFGTRVPMQCPHCFVLRRWRLEGKRNLFQGANTRIVCEVCKGAIAIDHPEYQRLPGTVEGEWVMQGPWRLE